ncbi:MAG: putative protein N(5)-glutamine methyltransferase [Nocardioidaceae bacterium]
MSSLDGLITRLRAAGCVFAEREARLIAATFGAEPAREQAVRRREAGEPLEYVVGAAEFAGITVSVGPPVFIPRRRAATLVDTADRVAVAPVGAGATTALDLGCGSGAIAAALTQRHPDWVVHASELDPAAAGWAQRNAATYGYTVHVGSWFDALPTDLRGGLDVVVAHLPYVPSDEIDLLPRDFRDHEPRHTVDGGVDGLDPLRAVCADSLRWLAPTGVLLTQVGWGQVETTASIAAAAGLAAEVTPSSDDDEDTVVVAVRPTSVDKPG